MIDRVKYLINSGESGINWMAIGPLLFFFIILCVIIIVTIIRRKELDDYDAHLPLEGNEKEENRIL